MNKQATQNTITDMDTTGIDVRVQAIKDKLKENNINSDWESATKAEKLIILHIESKLQEIIDFLR